MRINSLFIIDTYISVIFSHKQWTENLAWFLFTLHKLSTKPEEISFSVMEHHFKKRKSTGASVPLISVSRAASTQQL
jgi:hypothetical protein